jgi:general secretion pathway protein L
VSAASNRQLIVLASALDVLRTRAEVPIKGSAKLLHVLPFALEEQLAEDVETLHFAAGKREADGRVPVAVVRRALVTDWIARLSAAGLTPQRLYSEGDALGAVPNTVTLMVESHHAVLADADGSVTAIDSDGLTAFLNLWLARRADEQPDAPPPHLVVYAAPDLLASLEPLFDELRSRVESVDLRSTTDGLLPRLAARIVTAPGINLLQGSFAPRSNLAAALSPAWRISAALVLALLVAALAVQFAEIRSMRRDIASLDRDIDQAFHYVFPDAGVITDARGQLSSRLQQLGDRSAGGGHDFLDALRIIAQAVSGNPATRIEGINYRTGTMELRVRAPDVATLDRIQQRVTESGALKVQIQSANSADNEVVGRLQITRAGG